MTSELDKAISRLSLLHFISCKPHICAFTPTSVTRISNYVAIGAKAFTRRDYETCGTKKPKTKFITQKKLERKIQNN